MLENSECFAAAVELQVFFPLSKALQLNSQRQLGFKASLFQCLFSHFFSQRVLCVCVCERERLCVCVCFFFKLPGFQSRRIPGTLILRNSGVFDYLRVFSLLFFGGLFQRRILSTGTNFFSFLHFSFRGEFFFPWKFISNKPRSSLSSSAFVFVFVCFFSFLFPYLSLFLFELVNFVFLLCLTVFSHLHHSWNLTTAGLLTYCFFH